MSDESADSYLGITGRRSHLAAFGLPPAYFALWLLPYAVPCRSGTDWGALPANRTTPHAPSSPTVRESFAETPTRRPFEPWATLPSAPPARSSEPASPESFSLSPAFMEEIMVQDGQATRRREERVASREDLQTEVSRAARQELEALGFRQRADDIFTCELAARAHGWLGLGTVRTRSLLRARVSIDPVIGVRHHPTERLLAELLEEQLHRYGPPTLSAPLGHVMPGHEHRPWLFLEGHDPAERARRMAWAVRSFGLPFMKSHTTLDALASTLATPGFGFPFQNQLRLPVMYHLLGQNDRAEQYVAERLENLGKRRDPDAKYYRRFAAALREHSACTDLEHSADGCAAAPPSDPGKQRV